MQFYAIPHEYEDEVYTKSFLGISNRAIAKWLADKYLLAVSHEAVRSCVKRVTKQKMEADEDLFAPAMPPGMSLRAMARIERRMTMISNRAWRKGDDLVALKAESVKFKIATKQLEHERFLMKSKTRVAKTDAPEVEPAWPDGDEQFVSLAAEVSTPPPPEPPLPPLNPLDPDPVLELKLDEQPDHFPIDPLRNSDPRAWYEKHGLPGEQWDQVQAEMAEECRLSRVGRCDATDSEINEWAIANGYEPILPAQQRPSPDKAPVSTPVSNPVSTPVTTSDRLSSPANSDRAPEKKISAPRGQSP